MADGIIEKIVSPGGTEEVYDDMDSIDDFPELYPYQVGGHHLITRHPTRSDWIVKNTVPKERAFYQAAQLDPELCQVISSYNGIYKSCSDHHEHQNHHQQLHHNLNSNCQGDEHLILEDLTSGMVEPCLLDVQIGRRLYDEEATVEKRTRMIRKAQASTSASCGFRLSGLRYIDAMGIVHVKLKKSMRALSSEELLPTLNLFLQSSDEYRSELIARYLERIESIKQAVIHSHGLFYSSSILLLYDGKDPRRWDCRMIDFVHSRLDQQKPSTIIDTNYIEGLECFSNYLSLLS